MDIAIVTGAETPLGQRITERLIEQGCRVHGIGNNFSKVTYADPQFEAHAVDLTDLAAVQATTQAILDKEKRVHILVHAIDVTPGTAFRKLPLGNLEAILKIGLLGPVMLTRMLLPNLMRFRGQLINIIPANKSGHEASAINALIEGGLRSMNNALFDQARDAGLRVTNLLLRQNTELPAGTASDEQLIQSRIDPEDVANTVERLLDPHAINVPNEISLYPQLSPQAEEALPEAPEPLDPYAAVVLPPRDYFPPEPEPIPTKQADSIERVIPYTDEEMEEMVAAALEDFEANPERYKREAHGNEEESAQDDQGSGKKKRRRRRGGRNRNKNRGENDENTLDSDKKPAEGKQADTKPKAESTPQEKSEDAPTGETQQEDKPKRRRGGRNRNRDRKPRPEEGEGTSQETETAPPKDPRSNRRRSVREKLESEDRKDSAEAKPETKAPAPDSTPASVAENKPVKKKAAKKRATKTPTGAAQGKKVSKASEPEPLELKSDEAKPAKKAAKKAANKKTAKKAAKKAAKKKTATKKAAKKVVSDD